MLEQMKIDASKSPQKNTLDIMKFSALFFELAHSSSVHETP